jgi:hypothetical protein
MTRLVVPLRIRSTGEAGRKVTWLELFFDLIFVAAVGEVAEPLRHDYALAELARFAPLFILIWWAWMGHTVFSTRFDTDDVVQRGLTFVQIFAVAAMAANAKDALDSRSSAGFAAAYAAVRFVLVAQYVRARHVSDARALTVRYGTGHGAAALLWLLSALTPAPARFWIWALAFAIDLGTPWLAVPHSIKVPPDAAHLPERFGLFTLILLGESVVAVMQGMESQENWPPDGRIAHLRRRSGGGDAGDERDRRRVGDASRRFEAARASPRGRGRLRRVRFDRHRGAGGDDRRCIHRLRNTTGAIARREQPTASASGPSRNDGQPE